MPFLDEIDAVRDKVPTGNLPRPVLAGIVCVAVAIVVLAALGVASSARGDFVVGTTASSSSAAMERSLSAIVDGSAATAEDTQDGAGSSSAASATCFVYVVGAVKHPGVYEVPADSRVNDAVSAAGGFTKKADASAVNLARVVVDGEQITIPEKGEARAPNATESVPQLGDAGGQGSASDPNGKVNINTATSEELQGLPGIGEATAAKIIASRESEGPFTSTEDLKRVSGIGDKKYAALEELVTI